MASPPERSDSAPVYRRIADELRAAILAGELRHGDRLPGENAIMANYGVARATARQALAVLINEGLAVARRGAGVFVREFRPIRRHGSRRLSRAMWSAGRAIWDVGTEGRPYAVDDLTVYQARAPGRVARALDIQPQDTVWIRDRRYVVEETPVQLAISYFPADLVAGTRIVEPNPGPGGVYARLAELDYGPARFTEEIRARMPLPEEVQRLGLSPGTPVIVVGRTALTEAGRPVEFNEMILDAASYVLQYDFQA